MTIKDILESEKRNTENLYEIHLYMEGMFWRAYEWSAYLCRHFPSELNEDERLKPLKKLIKDSEDGYIQVGLQLSSFDKYFPNVTSDEKKFKMLDKHIIINANDFFDGYDFSNYELIFKKWKSNIGFSQNERKKQRSYETQDISTITSDSLINEIISYPIERKNLVDSLNFLSYIRDKAIKLTKTS